MVQQLPVQPGHKVLIHAAAGGVGHFAVQIAKYLSVYVIGTASAANRDFVLSPGADEHIDYTAIAFEEQVKEVDFILDTIGGDNVIRSLDALKKGGTVISLPSGLSEGIEEKAKAKGVNGFFFLVSSNGEHMQQLAELLDKGILPAHVSQTFPFEQMTEAHAQVESGRTRGKIVVTP